MNPVRNLDWYINQYGEDWAELVRDEDTRINSENESLNKIKVEPFDRSTSWAFNEVSGQ